MPVSQLSVRPVKRLGRPRTNACEICRSAKVKCDERQPLCSRCSRLDLRCSWPHERALSLPSKPTAIGKKKILPKPPSRAGVEQLPSLHPEGRSPSRSISGAGDSPGIINVSDYHAMLLHSDGDGDSSFPLELDSLVDARSPPIDDHPSGFGSLLPSSSVFVHDFLLDDSLVLSGDEYQALSHYQHEFIAARLLKTPRWSTFECILQSVAQTPMAMHFLLAISSLDLLRRSPHPAISINVSKLHLRKGSEMLIHLMNVEKEPHHFSTLSSWFFLYLCMMNRDPINRDAVNRLSIAILNYVKRYQLDMLSAGVPSTDQSLAPSSRQISSSVEPGLIGRVLLFLAAGDVYIGFEGYGGYLAKYLYENEDLYWRIFSRQRYVLEQYWGPSYPEYEILHDLKSTPAMELHYKVSRVIQQINELSHVPDTELANTDIGFERQVAEIERDYNTILRMAKSARTPFSQSLRTANSAVTNFYFMQLYYFRLTVPDPAQPTPPHILTVMTDLMNIAYSDFTQHQVPGHELFQLPLFVVGIETKDRMHLDWIIARLSRTRFRTALREILSIQEQSKIRVSLARIRQILHSSSGSCFAI